MGRAYYQSDTQRESLVQELEDLTEEIDRLL